VANGGGAAVRVGISDRRVVPSVEAAREAEVAGADYIFFGPVFATPSKQNSARRKESSGSARCGRAVRVPVLAIGGVTVENVIRVSPQVRRAWRRSGCFRNLRCIGRRKPSARAEKEPLV